MKRKNIFIISLIIIVIASLYFYRENFKRTYVAVNQTFGVDFTPKDLIECENKEQWNANGDGYLFVRFKIFDIQKVTEVFSRKKGVILEGFPDEKIPINSFPDKEKRNDLSHYILKFSSEDSLNFDMLIFNEKDSLVWFYSQSQ